MTSTSVLEPRQQADAGEINGGLTGRLRELSAVTELLSHLPTQEIRAHVDAVRTFLHDDVLRHAHAEELLLFPVYERLSGAGDHLTAGLLVEHGTIRGAAGSLDELRGAPLTAAGVRRISGLLDGIGLVLASHLSHESTASMALLERLTADEQRRLRDELVVAAAQECMSATGLWPWNRS